MKTKSVLFILFLVTTFITPVTAVNDFNSANEAIKSAQTTKQYLFILFYEKKDDLFTEMNKQIDLFQKSSSKKTIKYTAVITDIKESGTVTKYGINQAPLPVVLVFAPNGAVTGGFPEKVTVQQLEKCIVSELTTKILKPLQEQKLVLVLLQNNKTAYNKESTDAATEFSNDTKLKGYVEIIKTDPANSENKEFVAQCKLDGKMSEATIVFLAPPGSIVGTYKGKTTKEILLSGLAKLSSCGSGGCGNSGGCGPK
jgi:hypothetical protein